MLNSLEAALRRYEQIRPKPQTEPTLTQTEKLALWLEQDVCEVIQTLLDHPEFRQCACWPIERLGGSRICDERRRIDAVDAAIVEGARALAAVAKQPALLRQLRRLGPHNEQLSGAEEVPVGSPPTPMLSNDVAHMEAIAERPWVDLASICDYFHPVSELNLKPERNEEGALRPRLATFIPFCNPRLQQLGDFVGRTMLARVEFWCDQLQRFYVRCQVAGQSVAEKDPGLWEAAGSAMTRLREAHESLRALFFGPEARRRDACVALVQVIAAHRPKTDLSWMGIVAGMVGNAADIPHRVRRRDGSVMTDQIAAALADVAPFCGEPITPEETATKACRAHRFVLVSGVGVRLLYWEGKKLPGDWTNKTPRWEFLWGLAAAALQGCGVDAWIRKAGRKPTSLKDHKNRIQGDLPSELYALIRAAGRGTYKLDLPAESICLLQYDEQSRLVPYVPYGEAAE